MEGINGSQETVSVISLWVSIISAVVSCISASVAFASFKRNSQLQEQMNSINADSLIDNGLKKYSNELNKLKSKLEPKIKEILSQASVAYSEILNEIDSENIPTVEADPFSRECLSYMADQIVTLWYHNFSAKLGRRHAISFIHEIGEILHIEPGKNTLRYRKNFVQISRFFENTSRVSKSAKSHPYIFNELLYSYYIRVSEPDKLHKDCFKLSKPIFDSITSMKNEFQAANEKIDRLMDENKIERISIQAFPELYDALMNYQACMSLFESFHVFNSHIQLKAGHLKLNQILEILLLLFIFQLYGYWGDPEICPA